MEFDKSKVYTALNADEVKVGSKGYFSDSLFYLKEKVSANMPTNTISQIYSESSDRRFGGDQIFLNSLFYLVEEPVEEKWRPYKDTDEMIHDFCIRFTLGFANYELPLIWAKSKLAGIKRLVKGYDVNAIYFDNTGYSLKSLFENYTYLDGSPCGIKEE